MQSTIIARVDVYSISLRREKKSYSDEINTKGDMIKTDILYDPSDYRIYRPDVGGVPTFFMDFYLRT